MRPSFDITILTSMLEKENRKAEFAIMATNNWYLNTYDVLKMMKN